MKKLILILLTLLITSGCDSKKQEAKPTETLSQFSARVIDQKITTLGLKQDEANAIYKYNSLLIAGDFNEPGHPIYSISQLCSATNQLPLGELFGDLDCNKETISRLEKLSKNSKSGVVEICQKAHNDPEQVIAGYSDKVKKIYWLIINKNEVFQVGVYKESADGEVGVGWSECDLKARAQWKSEEPIREAATYCKTDSTKCLTTKMLMTNFQGVPDIRKACEKSVREIAKWDVQFEYVTPFPLTWESKTDIEEGTLRLVDDSVKFQNGFGAWQRKKVTCHYNLKSKFAMSFVD